VHEKGADLGGSSGLRRRWDRHSETVRLGCTSDDLGAEVEPFAHDAVGDERMTSGAETLPLINCCLSLS
jgi:hypothetical protein